MKLKIIIWFILCCAATACVAGITGNGHWYPTVGHNELEQSVTLTSLNNAVPKDLNHWSNTINRSYGACIYETSCIQRTALTRYGNGIDTIRGIETQATPVNSVDANSFGFDIVLLSLQESIDIQSSSTGWSFSYDMSSNNKERFSKSASVMAFDDTGKAFNWTETWASMIQREWTNIASDFANTSKNRHIPVLSEYTHSEIWLMGSVHTLGNANSSIIEQLSLVDVSFAEHNITTDVNAPISGFVLLFTFLWVYFSRKKTFAAKYREEFVKRKF